jgi:hypothetical protein
MMTVEVPVPAEDVSTPMRKMREWLDHMGFEPSRFTWNGGAGRFVVGVTFKAAEEAAAFAEHFAGRVLGGGFPERLRKGVDHPTD